MVVCGSVRMMVVAACKQQPFLVKELPITDDQCSRELRGPFQQREETCKQPWRFRTPLPPLPQRLTLASSSEGFYSACLSASRSIT